jgi:predicted PurR-regulated permease PerM
MASRTNITIANYALPLALLAGFLEIIPTIGPILSAVPAVIVALTVSPTMALVVIGIYLVIQLAENNLVVPKIMQHAVGLNPVVIIIAILVGAELLGITGALLSLPFVSFVTVIFNSLESADTK